ncbi:hypothetical protein PBRA_002981 [Plasmodiophora brassicae]|uniref:Uncharacterized protein n=1 Tax=Plasmodiophora brassicae TaxID=37360 RepID=A0A0G4J7J9_PLABS|nr:hypothetical protein PBRA_002981 [Plasmodiophora brassicae]
MHTVCVSMLIYRRRRDEAGTGERGRACATATGRRPQHATQRSDAPSPFVWRRAGVVASHVPTTGVQGA